MSTEIFAVRLYVKTANGGQPLQVSKRIEIGVEVRNLSAKPVRVVGVLDGSELAQRYPHYLPEIEGPNYKPAVPEWPEWTTPLRQGDFRLLQPGMCFDPTVSTPGANYLPLIAFRDFVPQEPGSYQLALTFSTASPAPDQWLGTLPNVEQNHLLPLIAEVPQCTVVAKLVVNVY